MKTMMTVSEMISFIRYGEQKYVILTTACSNNVVYCDFYSNISDEFKSLDVMEIEFQDGCIILYVL